MTLARRLIVLCGLPVALIATWWFTSAGSTDDVRPPLSRILAVTPGTWFRERMGSDIAPSLGRLAASFILALLVGVTLGVVIGSARWLGALVEPVLELFRAIPPSALVPVLILIAGTGSEMSILAMVWGGVWPILFHTVEGVRWADKVLADTCRGYRIRGVQWLRYYVLRAASPQIVMGARQALSICVILMVISEMLATTRGLGHQTIEFQRGFQYTEMWSGVLILGVIGVALSLLFRLAERRILAWYHGMRAAGQQAVKEVVVARDPVPAQGLRQ
jgi:ABC-type nitrate/sulfonate/bicarbonate transport system permease component